MQKITILANNANEQQAAALYNWLVTSGLNDKLAAAGGGFVSVKFCGDRVQGRLAKRKRGTA